MTRMSFRWVIASLAVGCFSLAGGAETLLDERETFGPQPDSRIMHYLFRVDKPGVRTGILIQCDFKEGTGKLKVVGPGDVNLMEESFNNDNRTFSHVLDALAAPDIMRVEFSVDKAVGKLEVVAVELLDEQAPWKNKASGLLMIFAGVLPALGWWFWSRSSFRWFFIGAGLWAIGVGLKVLGSVWLNPMIMEYLKATMSYQGYLSIGSLYIGMQSSACEIGLTAFLAWLWRRSCRDAREAIAVGVGAGSFEAILLGAGTLAGMLAMSSGNAMPDVQSIFYTYMAGSTSYIWLVGPVERLMAIMCHAASRALVFYGVGTGQGRRVWQGFLLFAALDSVAGFAQLGELMGRMSLWWIELAFAPFAVASIILIRWCLRNWPSAGSDTPSPSAVSTAE